MKIFKNKKIKLIGPAFLIGILFFMAGVSLVSAAGCSNNEAGISLPAGRQVFASFLNPLASLAEKVVKDFGYDVVLAASPDPDFCGSDSVGCSGTGPYADISWVAAPGTVVGTWPLAYYILTVPGVGSYNTGTTNSYKVSSGLSNNTTYYAWSVEAYYDASPYGIFEINYWGSVTHPYGSFTISCPSPTVDLWSWPTFELPEQVHLRWTSTNANSCNASGDWSGSKPTQGNEYLSKPRGTYTFTLTCTGSGGSASDSVTVKVIQVPQCTFTANPGSIILPASSTLSWSCQYADACSIDQGIGSVNNVSGTKAVRPTKTTTYTLTCSGLDGLRSLPATITVGFVPWIREVIPR